MSNGSSFAQVAPLHRPARRQAGAPVRTPQVELGADVVALPSAVARVRHRHERDGALAEPVASAA